MDESTKEALIIRLNIILTKIQTGTKGDVEDETRLLLKEVKQGFVPPF